MIANVQSEYFWRGLVGIALAFWSRIVFAASPRAAPSASYLVAILQLSSSYLAAIFFNCYATRSNDNTEDRIYSYSREDALRGRQDNPERVSLTTSSHGGIWVYHGDEGREGRWFSASGISHDTHDEYSTITSRGDRSSLSRRRH